jgi:hypothetical protein
LQLEGRKVIRRGWKINRENWSGKGITQSVGESNNVGCGRSLREGGSEMSSKQFVVNVFQ